MDAIIHQFHRAAASYPQASALQQRHVAKLVSRLAPMLAPHATLLDIGCGTGGLAHEAASQARRWRVIGLDMATGMCRAAQAQQAHTIQADMHHVPIAPGCVQAITSCFALQWSANPAQLIQQIANLAAPGQPIGLLTFTCGTLAELAASRAHAQQAPQPIGQVFHTMAQYQRWCDLAKLTTLESAEHTETLWYENAVALCRSIKAMGASGGQQSAAGLGGRAALTRMLAHYDTTYATPKGTPASWHMGYWLLQKS